MISQETVESIWKCYREINTAENILRTMAELKEKHPHDPHAQDIRDVFGRGRKFQLGIPNGESGHQLMDVQPKLAESIIRAHIAAKKAEMVEANERAKIELESQ